MEGSATPASARLSRPPDFGDKMISLTIQHHLAGIAEKEVHPWARNPSVEGPALAEFLIVCKIKRPEMTRMAGTGRWARNDRNREEPDRV